jgi:predicted nucleotidyltransferase
MSTVDTPLLRVPAVAQADVERAVAVLSREPGVQRVWLFGSLAKGRQPDFRSDIDLAVMGLPQERALAVWAELDEALRLPPDLVRWEEANPTLRDQIERWGMVVYERA